MGEMAESLTLEWSYTPPDFFEEPPECHGDGYVAEIGNGRIVAKVSSVPSGPIEGLAKEIREQLETCFSSVQLFNSRPYELSEHLVTRIRADGTSVISVSASLTAHACLKAEVEALDKDGRVIFSSKKKRAAEMKALVERACAHLKNPVLRSLLKSYKASVDDPDNLFIHLYEIRDAMGKCFGHPTNACPILGISKRKDWSRLGYLADEAPLRQGRHRGANIGQLRDATPVEIDEARAITKRMIEGYINYLESTGPARNPEGVVTN